MANWTLGQVLLIFWNTLELTAQVAPVVNRLLRMTDYGYKEGQAAQHQTS